MWGFSWKLDSLSKISPLGPLSDHSWLNLNQMYLRSQRPYRNGLFTLVLQEIKEPSAKHLGIFKTPHPTPARAWSAIKMQLYASLISGGSQLSGAGSMGQVTAGKTPQRCLSIKEPHCQSRFGARHLTPWPKVEKTLQAINQLKLISDTKFFLFSAIPLRVPQLTKDSAKNAFSW